jgi:phosphoribosylanthranilate isomerase
MPVAAKICGLATVAALDAAIDGGARQVGFVCYPRSPRHVSREEAQALSRRVPLSVERVGLFVDPDDQLLVERTQDACLDVLQLHGSETPERVAVIRQRFGLPVMKAIKLATRQDLAEARRYVGAADRLLFDPAEPPPERLAGTPALPGGNGLPFDWTLLEHAPDIGLPWMLAGGLTPDNVAEAVRVTAAGAVDVSSGVEERRGVKSPALISRFLAAVAALP